MWQTPHRGDLCEELPTDENQLRPEAEIRAILDEAVRPADRVKVGSALAALRARFGGVEIDVTRDPAPTEAAKFNWLLNDHPRHQRGVRAAEAAL